MKALRLVHPHHKKALLSLRLPDGEVLAWTDDFRLE
jgi:hypothetical protein